MKNLIKIMLFPLLLISLSACDKSTKGVANEAQITINKTIYNLPIQVCNKPRTDTFKGQSITHYSIVAQGFTGKAKTELLINGVKGKRENIANYKFELDQKGSFITVVGKIPYDNFDGENLNFKGETVVGKKSYPIEMVINCK